jgi:NADPH-dependent 7-cyano-7-deazaguanine reductase QueF-like protein
VNFTEAWQNFEQTKTIGVDDVWSLAFNLCSDATNGRTPNVFYFDDLSWETMKLEEGYFIAGINTAKTSKYENLNDAIEFKDVEGTLEATVGKKGDEESYVNQVMISTVKGDNTAFMNSTLKPTESITNDPDNWISYELSSLAKLDLPGLGVWTVYLDTDYSSMAFEMIEGKVLDPIEVFTYTDEITVNGQEREYTEAEAEAAGVEKPENPGQPWDNQFFIVADRVVNAGEVTKIKFQYKATVAGATSGTQSHGEPGGYIHWAAIGSLTFEEEWQDFENDFTIPAECDGSEGKQFKSIAFNLAEIKGACDYSFKNIQWYLPCAEEGMTYENLISGSTNFYKKEGAGTNPYTGIENVTVKNAKTSNVMYNLAGQRVSKDFKGIVVKDGKKFVK